MALPEKMPTGPADQEDLPAKSMYPPDNHTDRKTPEPALDFEIHGDPGPLFAAMAEAQAAYGELTKSKTVTVTTKKGYTYTFDYAPLEEVLEACRPALNQHGVTLLQPLARNPKKPGGAFLYTILGHKTGSYLKACLEVDGGQDVKELGSSITYLRRYSIQSVLGVAADDDDDAGAATGDETVPMRRGFQRADRVGNGDGKPLPEQLDRLRALVKQANDKGIDHQVKPPHTAEEAATLIATLEAQLEDKTAGPSNGTGHEAATASAPARPVRGTPYKVR